MGINLPLSWLLPLPLLYYHLFSYPLLWPRSGVWHSDLMNKSTSIISVYGKHGLTVRLLYVAVALAWWPLRAITRRIWPGKDEAVVLCYHGVAARQRQAFAWQMSRIADRAVDVSASKGAPAGRYRPWVCVTFDDAFANLLENALPVTGQLAIPTIVFAVAGCTGQRPSWDIPSDHPEAQEPTMMPAQLRQAANQALCRVGSHTMTHPALARCAPPAIRQECRHSKTQIEEYVKQPVEDLALPYGSCSGEVLAAALASGYKRVYTLEPRLHRLGCDGAIGRFSMTPDAWRIEFWLTCNGGYAWLHAWRRVVRHARRLLRPAARQEPSLA